jgi:hypothetical protein
VKNTPKIDWLRFFIHFVFGAVIGGVFGFKCWAKSSYALSTSITPGILFVGGGAILFGFIAGCFRDDFWYSFKERFLCRYWWS